jgi:hypothetical protein
MDVFLGFIPRNQFLPVVLCVLLWAAPLRRLGYRGLGYGGLGCRGLAT